MRNMGVSVLMLAFAALILTQMPDIMRYMKMRSM